MTSWHAEITAAMRMRSATGFEAAIFFQLWMTLSAVLTLYYVSIHTPQFGVSSAHLMKVELPGGDTLDNC